MVDYEFYSVIYRGKAIAPDEWAAAEREASATLERYKRKYTVTEPAGTVDAEKMAVCAMADVLMYHAKAESGALASAAIGSVSVSYASSSTADHSRQRQEKDTYQAACMYLDIYRGVC